MFVHDALGGVGGHEDDCRKQEGGNAWRDMVHDDFILRLLQNRTDWAMAVLPAELPLLGLVL